MQHSVEQLQLLRSAQCRAKEMSNAFDDLGRVKIWMSISHSQRHSTFDSMCGMINTISDACQVVTEYIYHVAVAVRVHFVTFPNLRVSYLLLGQPTS